MKTPTNILPGAGLAFRDLGFPGLKLIVCFAALATSFLLPGSLQAQSTGTTSWISAGTGSWFDSSNWDNGLPDSLVSAHIQNSGTAIIPSGTGTAQHHDLFVGGSESGTLLIENGGTLVGRFSRIGVAGTGHVVVSGGTWISAITPFHPLIIPLNLVIGAESGTGSAEIHGGLVSSAMSLIGAYDGHGSVIISSGTWINSDLLAVGVFSGTGSVEIQGGLVSGTLGVIGSDGGTGVVTVSGGALVNSSTLAIGFSAGSGSLTVGGNGLVSNTVTIIATQAGSSGTLNLNGGVMETGAVDGGEGAAILSFDGGTLRATGSNLDFISGFTAGVSIHSGGAFIDSGGFAIGSATNFTGTGGLAKLGSGTLTLTGTNTYSGATDLEEGTLVIDGANNGNGATTVANSATLAGSGTIAGAVTVEDGGILAPGNSAGTLTVGSLLLDANADLQFELGTSSDLVAVLGNLTLGGNLSVTDLPGFGGGSYTLFTYGGVLTGTESSIIFQTMPSDYHYAIDLSTAGEVRLTVSPTELYWDGSGTTPNGEVNGGDGTWDNSTTNWTTVSGSSNFAWDSSGTAIFSGTAGTVTVAETIAVADMAFETTGYVLSGTGELAISGAQLTVNTGSGVDATIGTAISGTGALVKTGTDGTVILTGSNTYTGGTIVRSGTLAVDGGSISHNATGLIIGAASGDHAALLLAGGHISNLTGAIGGNDSYGSATITSGTWSNSAYLFVGSNSGTGTLLVDGGLVSSSFGLVGYQGTGSAAVVSGTWWNDGHLSVGDTTGTGTLQIDGGLVRNTDGTLGNVGTGSATVASGTWRNDGVLTVGSSGSGSLTISGGLVTSATTRVADQAGSFGTLNLNGGVLETGAVFNGTGTAVFSFDGGTLRATGDNAAFVSGFDSGVTIHSGGAFIDSGTFAIGSDRSFAGAGALTKLGAGTLSLTGSSSYEGGTQLSNGALLIGNVHALGSGTLAIGDGTALGRIGGSSPVANDVVIHGDFTALPGTLNIDGTVDLGGSTRRIYTESGSALVFAGEVFGNGGITIAGTGKIGLYGEMSYTGLTTVENGAVLELNQPGVAINGGLVIDSGGYAVTFVSEKIADTSEVTVNGYFQINYVPETIGGLFGSGTISLLSGSHPNFEVTLAIGSGNFSGRILEDEIPNESSLVKWTSGTLTLAGANTYRGGTTIEAGTLQTANLSALGVGPVALNAGSLAPVGQLDIRSLAWNGGTITSALGTTTSLVNITNDLTLTTPGEFVFTLAPGFAGNTAYAIMNAANLGGFLPEDFTGTTLGILDPTFTIMGNTLFVSYNGLSTGAVIQNSGPVFTPVTADFLVNGPVTTGSPMENNTVNSLNFNPGSSLQIFNNLTVTSGDFTVPTGSAKVTGGNAVVPGTFSKFGAGLLNILSNVQVNGPANVMAGSLLVNGVFTTGGGLTVFQNALLGGAGIINGNVFNNGIVSPGNSPGTLTINGNYVQSSGGTLQIEPGDLLWVSGNASLAGTLRLMAAGKLKYGQQITFLRAGSISGEFDQIAMPDPDRFRGRLLVEGGTGTLLVAPTSYTLVAETTNQRNVAKALDSFIPAKNNDRETVSLALDLQSEEQYPAAFDQIAPTYYESLGLITIEQAFAQTQQLNQRLSAVRLGARGFQAIGLESPLVHDKDGKSVMESKDVIPQSAIRDPNWSLWAMGNGQFARLSSIDQLPNTTFNSGGFLVGADYTFGNSENPKSKIENPRLTVGLFTGYQYTWADAGDAGSTQINSALFGGYATYRQGRFYADGVLGGGYNGYRVRRSIEFSTIDRTARSQPNGGQLNASLNLGYDWQAGKFTFGPIVGGQYTYAGIAGFTETGADSLNLRVAQQNINSLRTTLGGRVAYTWNVTDKIALIPELRMFWQHEFLNNPRNISSSLDGGAGPTFGYETTAPARDSVFAGAGVSAQFGERWNAFVYWNVDFGRQTYFGNSVSGGLNWKF
jgi:fibronectin-binding autotransporter adhesin